MTERDKSYVENMLMFALRVQSRINSVDLATFLHDEEKQDLVLYPLGQLGENANKVSEEFRDKNNNILWNPVIGVRNRIFHSYGDISMEVIFEIATNNIPTLISQLQEILNHSEEICCGDEGGA